MTMKRILMTTAFLCLSVAAFAQKTAFINSETVFRSLPEYNSAIEELDRYAQQQQSAIDDEFARIAETYERYQYQRANLSENARRQVEENILSMEQMATEKQAGIFGPEGELMKRRVSLLKPIQDRVFELIDTLARQRGCDVILDISNNPSVLYFNQENDLTDEVVRLLGITK